MFENAISSLNEEDRDLSAIRNIKRYLMKGIGVHHGGLIPLVKELVEILFQESLVKVRQWFWFDRLNKESEHQA